MATSLNGPASEGYAPENCKSLGPVIGEGGGYGGGWISNDELMRHALNDARNKAAEMGANFMQYASPQLGNSGDKYGSTTTSATIMGTAYVCEAGASSSSGRSSTSSNDNAGSKSPTPPAQKSPEGAAGFRFGSTVQQAQMVCEKGGHTFLASGTSGDCSGLPSNLGAPGSVELAFCEGAVCQIQVTLLPDDASYLGYYKNLGSNLKQRYGKPFSKANETDHCTTPEQLSDCVIAKTATIAFEWRWPSKYRVRLSTATDGKRASVLLTYANPKMTALLDPGPAL